MQWPQTTSLYQTGSHYWYNSQLKWTEECEINMGQSSHGNSHICDPNATTLSKQRPHQHRHPDQHCHPNIQQFLMAKLTSNS